MPPSIPETSGLFHFPQVWGTSAHVQLEAECPELEGTILMGAGLLNGVYYEPLMQDKILCITIN